MCSLFAIYRVVIEIKKRFADYEIRSARQGFPKATRKICIIFKGHIYIFDFNNAQLSKIVRRQRDL